MSKHINRGWDADDFDYRASNDQSPELFLNFVFLTMLPPLMRMLAEDSDFVVMFNDNCQPTKILKRRDPECIPFVDPELDPPEESTECDPEDAMNVADSLGKYRVKDRWDNVYEAKAEWSAPIFPKPRDKRLRSNMAKGLEKAIQRGISKQGLYLSIKRSKLNGREAARLWELWKIQSFLNSKNIEK